MDPDVAALIARYGMNAIPGEGGWFCQTWRSPVTLAAGTIPGYQVDKPAGTAILALFSDRADGFSALHRLATPEVWDFCGGDGFALLLLRPDATSSEFVLGPPPTLGHDVQVVVPAGTWMGGRVAPGGRFSLLGCTMAPGFTSDDVEIGAREELIAAYPSRAGRITGLTRPPGGGEGGS